MTKDPRFIGELPKIGIRPTIDGRRKGVRESLEETTMNLAKSVSDLLQANIFYYTGKPVDVVIADTCIGGVAESAKAAEKFKQEGVGVSITVTPCWCYGAETMDMDPHTPKAVWGFNGTERPGAVYLAAVLAAYNQKGLPAFGIYGKDVQDAGDTEIPADVQEKLLRFAKAGLSVAMMRNKSYLAMGSVSMGIAGSNVQDEFFQDYLGMRNEYIDMTEFIRRMEEEIYDEDEFEIALAWVKENCTQGMDNNPDEKARTAEQLEEDWKTSIKMALITKDLMIGNEKLAAKGFEEEALGRNAIISGFQGQRQWTDYMPNGDFMEAILNTSFDWNGKRAPFLVATENDSLNAVSMLFGYLLTNRAQLFADVRTYWSPDAVNRVTGHELTGKAEKGIIHLLNSGAATLDGTGGHKDDNGNTVIKPFYEVTDKDIERSLSATSWRPANTEYFRGGGYSSNFLTEGEMPVTISRINIVKGLGPVLQIAEGYTVDIPKEVHQQLDARTDSTWPTTWFVPNLTGKGAFTDVYSVMNNWGANHCSMSYGHIGADLISLASLLRIPVNMHNVSEEKVFRPDAWSMFGTQDKEAADYRACQNFGPIYK
ncbi:L-fucose isomerase [Virgibacillus halodenitrificans]|uniref:L-fucose isomerase n=1 Tax=Virgibacillus halodenitrificans TaxID=1482 RepID=A0ABR7VKH8_VIRHA|nr:L-fucose isomerase [Virgibacillus halodenitrificans]MBD1221357.1 L-fucose isomerase [Virgibacillus halodenitrificans]WHX26121.1 L-fucose isomerase [Virgibacillus halodenitrificans]